MLVTSPGPSHQQAGCGASLIAELAIRALAHLCLGRYLPGTPGTLFLIGDIRSWLRRNICPCNHEQENQD
jgi:hypothetical protein